MKNNTTQTTTDCPDPTRQDDAGRAKILSPTYEGLEKFVWILLTAIGEHSKLDVFDRPRLTDDERNLVDALTETDEALCKHVEKLVGTANCQIAVDSLKPLVALAVNGKVEGKDLYKDNGQFTIQSKSWMAVACANKLLHVVDAFIERCELDINAYMSRERCTLLHIAAAAGCTKIVALLLQKKANRKIEDTNSRIPIQVAAREKDEHVVPVLQHNPGESTKSDPILPFGTRLGEKNGDDTKRIIISPIGRGGFGRVYLTQHVETGKYEAAKVVLLPNPEMPGLSFKQRQEVRRKRVELLRSAISEAEFMLTLREDGIHPNIVAIREVGFLRNVSSALPLEFKENLFIFMDFVQGPTLFDYAFRGEKKPLESLAFVLHDVALGLLHLDEKNITVRDLKPGNILVEVGGDRPRGKLADFGDGKTPKYASREMVLEMKDADETTHVWTFGTTLLAMVVCGMYDWSDYSGAVMQLDKALKGNIRNDLHRNLLDLCTRCMQGNPSERCSMNEVYETLSRTLSVGTSPDVSVTIQEDHVSEVWRLHHTLGQILGRELTKESGDFERARKHFDAGLELAAMLSGEESQVYSQSLNELALLLHAQGFHDQAKRQYERALGIREKALGPDHLDVAKSLNNLALLLHHQGNLDQAKRQYERSLGISEKAVGPDQLEVATTLNNLASLLQDQGDLEQAKKLYGRALDIRKKELGPDHLEVATTLSNLALLLHHQGHLDQAKLFYERALGIGENALGPDHPNVAAILDNLATLLVAQGHLEEAKGLFERVLVIRKNTLGPNHSEVAITLNNLASLLHRQGHLDQAKPRYERAIEISEEALGPNHPNVAAFLYNFASLLQDQGQLEQGKRQYERALDIRERVFGPDHPEVATTLNNLALTLKHQGHLDQAKPLYERALKIRENALRSDHPNVVKSLNNLATLLVAQGHLDQAKPLFERALKISEESLGPKHPNVAAILRNLALLGHLEHAKPLYERAFKIQEKALGPDHPHVAETLNNFALLLKDQGHLEEAKLLYERALNINVKALGRSYPVVVSMLRKVVKFFRSLEFMFCDSD